MAKSSRNRKTRSRQGARKSSKAARNTGTAAAAGSASRKNSSAAMVFSSRNYQLMMLGVALVVIGYAMMRIENEVDGFISLYLAPLIILGGYLEIIYAILWRPKPKSDATDQSVEVAAEG